MLVNNSQTFCSEYESKLKSLAIKWTQIFRSTPAWTDPKFFEEDYITVLDRSLKEDELIVLILIHWYLPKDYRGITHLVLESSLKKLPIEQRGILSNLLKDPNLAKLTILETSYFARNPREFFGKVLSIKLPKVIFKRLLSKKITYPQRKRGYHDHGTLKPDHQWTEHFDYSLTDEQRRREGILIDGPDFLEGGIS